MVRVVISTGMAVLEDAQQTVSTAVKDSLIFTHDEVLSIAS